MFLGEMSKEIRQRRDSDHIAVSGILSVEDFRTKGNGSVW